MTVTFPIVLSVLLLAVAIFALENAQAVTVRFLYWQLQSSVAVVALAATAAGALVAGLFGFASRPQTLAVVRDRRERDEPVRRGRGRPRLAWE